MISRTASKESISADDILICLIDEWNNGEKHSFDCSIVFIREGGVDVCYLSGYRSRNDFVKWEDIAARVDLSFPVVKVHSFKGHFEVFNID